MVRNIREVGENRYREEYGRFFEDFTVGDVYEHRPNRTITETDNYWFTLITMNNHPLHFDAEYAAQTEWDQELVNSALTLSVVLGMTVSDVSYQAVANLGWEEVRLTNPVFHGDTLTAESEVVRKRESESRPGQGIVTVETTGFKQTGEKVIEFTRSALIPTREAAGESASTDEADSTDDQ
ncbi:MaoC family dehydratase [Halovivax gelatinilyticus]|uniref:MaoC family dehydratase n=1 Tax=Halovivax gelatinilyticus TaxID=2961597 RepID=UPI0020CA33F0|nr:MaoC family dehydratase [Halovivax gelatinilyticus]